MQYRLLCVVSCALMLGSGVSQAQERSGDAPIERLADGTEILEKGAHHRVVSVPVEVDPLDFVDYPEEGRDALIAEHSVSVYTELEGGMHYWDERTERWLESVEAFEVFEDEFVAQRGQTKVILRRTMAPESDGVDKLTSDGVRLLSNVVGLVYYDRATGESLLLSELQATEGLLLPPNQVVYLDAFEGDVAADLRYTYKKGIFEQDVVLREQPPVPEEYGLDSRTTTLEVWTEFVSTKEPSKVATTVKEDPRGGLERILDPDIVDEEIDFGELRLGEGRAFNLDDRNGRPEGEPGRDVKTAKRWMNLENARPGSRVLIEAVQVEEISEDLADLPKASASANPRRDSEGRQGLLAQLPKKARNIVHARDWGRGLVGPVNVGEERMIASAAFTSRPGYVLDYVGITANQSNYTFARGKTYTVTGLLYFSGTTTLQGGAVIKYPKQTPTSLIYLTGPVVCETDHYSPLIITGVNDDSVGETISGSSGNMNTDEHGYYGFYLKDVTTPQLLEHIHVRNTRYGFLFNKSGHTLRNFQIVNSRHAVYVEGSASVNVQNGLIHGLVGITESFRGGTGTVNGWNLTIAACEWLRTANITLNLGNSIIAEVDDIDPYTTIAPNQEVSDISATFESAGAGGYYLKTGSTLRNAGDVPDDGNLYASLRAGTTMAPAVFGQYHTLSEDVTFTKAARRDDDGLVDLGYHYSPIDYAVNYLYVESDRTLSVMPGTVVGQYGSRGIVLKPGSALSMDGTAEDRIRMLRFDLVQEQPKWDGISPASSYLYIGGAWGGADRSVSLRFVDFPIYERVKRKPFYSISSGTGRIQNLNMRDCRSIGGYWQFYCGNTYEVSNNVFDDSFLSFQGIATFNFRNNFVKDGSTSFNQSAGVWYFEENLFDKFHYSSTPSLYFLVNNYNAYLSANPLTYQIGGYYQGNDDLDLDTDDVNVSGAGYETGPFGDYYQNSILRGHLENAGYRTAVSAGMTHYTVQTSGAKDTGNVAIGFHHPAHAKVKYLGRDLETHGDWKGPYGALGYNIATHSSSFPSGVSMSTSGASTWVWSSSTSDTRALEKATGSGRIASCWYSSTSFNINYTAPSDETYKVTLYCLSWDVGNREVTIQVKDGSTVLDTRVVTGYYTDPEYVSWEVNGSVTFHVQDTGAASNGAVSALFIDEAQPSGYDTDFDGIPDYVEDADGSGSQNGNETDFTDADTDNDGALDGVEIANGTDPFYLDNSELGLTLSTP